MAENNFYSLSELPYNYKILESYMPEEQLKIHHDKHNQGYIIRFYLF